MKGPAYLFPLPSRWPKRSVLCEKLAMGHNIYSVRPNQGYRFVFQLYPDSNTRSLSRLIPRDEACEQALMRPRI